LISIKSNIRRIKITKNSFLTFIMKLLLVLLAWQVGVFVPNLLTLSLSLWLRSSLPIVVLFALLIIVFLMRSETIHLSKAAWPTSRERSILLLAMIVGLLFGIFITNIYFFYIFPIKLAGLFVIFAIIIALITSLRGRVGTALIVFFLSMAVLSFIRAELRGTHGSVALPFFLLWFPEDSYANPHGLGPFGDMPFEVLFIAVISAGWLLNSHFKRTGLKRTPLDWPILVFVLGCFISIPFSQDVKMSMSYLIEGVFVPFMLYYVVVNCATNESEMRRVIIAVLLYTFVASGYNFHRLIQTSGLRIEGLTPEVARGVIYYTFSKAVSPVWALTLVLCLAEKEKAAVRILALLTFIVGSVMMFFELSRTVWLVGASQAIGLAWLSKRCRPYIFLIAFLLVIGAFLGWGTFKATQEAVRPQLWTSMSEMDLNTMTSNRIFIWRQTLEWIGENPFVGVGLGTTIKLFVPYFQNNAHNNILQLWLEGGLIPALAMLVIMIVVLKQAVHLVRVETDPHLRDLRVSYLLGILAWLFHSLTATMWALNHDISYTLPMVTLWALAMAGRSHT